MTGKKPRGMRLAAREVAFVQFHRDEGSVEVVVVPGTQQRANPLTKALRSASVHFREAEWLMGTSPELTAMQAMAEERGRSKRSLRPEVVIVAGFAGYGVLGSRGDTEWAERATDQRETGIRSDAEEKAVVQRNTLANSAPKGGRSFRVAALLEERKGPLREERERRKRARWVRQPNHGNASKFGANMHTPQELASLIFRLDDWMVPAQEFVPETDAPSDDEAVEMRQAQEEERAESDSDGDEDAAQAGERRRKRARAKPKQSGVERRKVKKKEMGYKQ